MPKIAYVNGRYVHHAEAVLPVEDRATQFSDAVYEVIAFYNHILLDEDLHVQRLMRSLEELAIVPFFNQPMLRILMRELIARNNRIDGTIYIQISRGIAKRDHVFPKHTRPSIVMTVTGAKMPKAAEVLNGVSVITQADIRWGRRDIKTVSLLANVLAKQAASTTGAREAWLVNEQGMITEGAVSNNMIINEKGEILTTPLGNTILGGVTRNVVLEMARKAGFRVIERSFSVQEAYAAEEAFLTSTTNNILPVVMVDSKKVGQGKPGEITLQLLQLYYDHIYQQTGKKWN